MKTGRIRTKEQPPEEQVPLPQLAVAPSPEPAPGPTGKLPTVLWIVGGILIIFVCFLMIMTVFGRKGADEWVEVTRVSGRWTTTVTLFGPQATIEEHWESDCTGTANAVVRPGTCIKKDTQRYQDKMVKEYDEYAYNIYYEETYDQVYEASGTEFVATQLKTDDWWQEKLHYVLVEKLDKDSCQYTNYTVWVDDPQNKMQQIEVYLSDCEVWDHVTVYERVYEQALWCQCDVTKLVQMGQLSEQGSGLEVRWPAANVPAGGRADQSFQGQVTFLGNDKTYTTTTQDPAQYRAYLSGQYYLGLRDGKPVAISSQPPQK